MSNRVYARSRPFENIGNTRQHLRLPQNKGDALDLLDLTDRKAEEIDQHIDDWLDENPAITMYTTRNQKHKVHELISELFRVHMSHLDSGHQQIYKALNILVQRRQGNRRRYQQRHAESPSIPTVRSNMNARREYGTMTPRPVASSQTTAAQGEAADLSGLTASRSSTQSEIRLRDQDFIVCVIRENDNATQRYTVGDLQDPSHPKTSAIQAVSWQAFRSFLETDFGFTGDDVCIYGPGQKVAEDRHLKGAISDSRTKNYGHVLLHIRKKFITIKGRLFEVLLLLHYRLELMPIQMKTMTEARLDQIGSH